MSTVALPLRLDQLGERKAGPCHFLEHTLAFFLLHYSTQELCSGGRDSYGGAPALKEQLLQSC